MRTTSKTKTEKTTRYRKISFLKKHGDIEWLRKGRCPECKESGRLRFGMHPREKITCDNCGHRFRIKGRPVKKKEKK